jgi:8-oxo-dGTP pyrophosphatase MutT (NUDIX family)
MGDRYCFGIDIGGTTVKLGLFQIDGTLMDKWEVITRTTDGGEAILPDIAESIQSKLDEHQISKDLVIGLGVGVPAATKDGIVKSTANLGWGYKNVKRELEEELDMRVKVGGLYASHTHEYPDFIITLWLYECEMLSDFVLKEHESYAWIAPKDLDETDWAPADADILATLKRVFGE